MAASEWLDVRREAAPALGESRARVLAVLQESRVPLGVGDVAKKVGLHANTARFHLDGLVEAGIVERTSEERAQPGRPRALYVARPEAKNTGRRSYRLLAEILTSYIAAEDPHPERAATEAGRAWGHYLADRPPPFSRADAETATAQLVDTLGDIGFAPEATTSGRQRRILLHNCPFREAADAHRNVVCSIHLGLMQGVLTEIDAPVNAERLVPFAEPNVCVAYLGNRKRRTGGKQSRS